MPSEYRFAKSSMSVQMAESLMSMSDNAYADMRKEYTRMRDAAQKRLARLGKEFPDVAPVREHPEGFPKLKTLSKQEFATAFSDLAKFMAAKGSTVSGQRAIKRKTMKTMASYGINVTDQNYKMFIKLMEQIRKQKMMYGSDKILEMANVMTKLTARQQQSWLKHLTDLMPHVDDMQEIPSLRGMSFNKVMEMLD